MDWRTLKRHSEAMNETKDCSVRAVTAISEKPYKDIHKLFKSLGRVSRKGTPKCILRLVLSDLNIRTRLIFVKPKTVRTFEREFTNTESKFLVWTSGHVLAVINGKACDWSSGGLQRLIYVDEIV